MEKPQEQAQQRLLRPKSKWKIEANWLISPSGTKVARVENGVLYLFDKRTRSDVPLTGDDWTGIIQMN